jgi:hypothetical protein
MAICHRGVALARPSTGHSKRIAVCQTLQAKYVLADDDHGPNRQPARALGPPVYSCLLIRADSEQVSLSCLACCPRHAKHETSGPLHVPQPGPPAQLHRDPNGHDVYQGPVARNRRSRCWPGGGDDSIELALRLRSVLCIVHFVHVSLRTPIRPGRGGRGLAVCSAARATGRVAVLTLIYRRLGPRACLCAIDSVKLCAVCVFRHLVLLPLCCAVLYIHM